MERAQQGEPPPVGALAGVATDPPAAPIPEDSLLAKARRDLEEAKEKVAEREQHIKEREERMRQLETKIDQYMKVLQEAPSGSAEEAKAKYLIEASERHLTASIESLTSAQASLTAAQTAYSLCFEHVNGLKARVQTSIGTADDNAFGQVDEDVPGIATYMWRLLKQEVEANAERNDESIRKRFQPDSIAHFVDLAHELEGLVGSRRRIFVRNNMRSIVGRIISFLEGTSDPKKFPRWILLGGSRGCGKSVVGSMATIMLASKGHVVLYEHRGVRMLLLSENVSSEAKAILDKIMKTAKIPPISANNGVWILSDTTAHVTFFKNFTRLPQFIYVQDLGDQDDVNIPPHDGNGKRLIVSSPNALKLKLVARNRLAKILIMETWTLDDILQIEALDPDSVRSRFDRVGGIPRWVTDKQRGETELAQDEQIENLSLDTVLSVFSTKGYLELPSQVDKVDPNKSTDLVFRIEPASNTDDSKCKVVLSSKYVTRQLLERYMTENEDQVLRLVSAIHKSDGLLEFRGRVLETIVHRSMDKKTKRFFSTMSLFRLNEEPLPSVLLEEVPTIQFDSLNEFENIPDLRKDQLQAGAYFYAKRKNEKTIDSFAIVDRPFVEKYFHCHPGLEKNVGLFILFIQITVADSHVVDGTILNTRQKEACEVLEVTELPMIFVFISWQGGIQKHQAVTRKEGQKRKLFVNQNQFGPQYLIRLRGKFDKFAEILVESNAAEGEDLV